MSFQANHAHFAIGLKEFWCKPSIDRLLPQIKHNYLLYTSGCPGVICSFSWYRKIRFFD